MLSFTRLPRGNANPTGYNVKHITGKQLKNSFESDNNSGKIDVDANGLGAFTSKVNGLTRVSSLAVLYTDASDNFDGDLDQISGSTFYGYVTKDAVKKVVGGVDGIELYVWTGTENVKVFANTTKDSDYVAGTIVGYNAITEDSDGNKLIDGLTDLNAAVADSITEVGVNGDANTVRLDVLGEKDLGDFDAVLYMNTTVKDENGAQSGVVNGTPSEANAQQNVRPTNFLYVGNDVAVIDSVAFVSGPYAATTMDRDLDNDGTNDVQWVDTRTQDNTPANVYPGALVDLTFKVPAAGTLTVQNVKTNENGTPNPTYTYTAAQAGTDVVIEGLLVTGNVNLNWSGAAPANGTVYTNADSLNEDLLQGNVTATNTIPTGTYAATAYTLTLKDATLAGNVSAVGNVVLDGNLAFGTRTLNVTGTVTIKSTANIDDLSRISATNIVVERSVRATDVDTLLANTSYLKVASISDSATALATANLDGKKLEVVSGNVNTNDATSDANTTVIVGGSATTNVATLNGTWDVGTLTTGTTVELNGDFTANTLAGCTALTVGGSLDVETTAPALTTLTLNAGADVTLPDSASVSTTLTVAAGSATDKTTLVARGVTVATLALNANVDVTIAKLSTSVTAGDASAKLTFTDAQAVGLTLPAGTFVFQKAPTDAMTSIAAGTNLVFETGVDFKTIIPKSIATSIGATVKFTTAQPTVVETTTTDNGAFYAAGATTTALANTQIKTGVTYELSSGSGIANGTATGWVEQTA